MGTVIAEVVIEREFGSGSFLELYSGYVSKKIIELLELEKENTAEDDSEIAQQQKNKQEKTSNLY